MVKKGIIVLTLFGLTLILGIIELVIVNNTINIFTNKVNILYKNYETNKNNITIYYDEANELENSWLNQEKYLSYLFNHKLLKSITDSFSSLSLYTKNNIYEKAILELNNLKSYCENGKHMIGFNSHNVF